MDSHLQPRTSDSLELPRLTALLRHAAPGLAEGVIAPVIAFYLGLFVLGYRGAVIAAIAWVYGGIICRLVRRKKVPGTLMLAAVGITVRAAMALLTGSMVVYFLQPTLSTLVMAVTFLCSVLLRRPLALKLATDLLPMPAAFIRHTRVRRFFQQISLLWSMVLLANTAVSLWLLLSQSIADFLWLRTTIGMSLGAAAVGISVLGFRRCLRHVDLSETAAVS
jgi:hypothetical protein